jgi:hypothetical protein
MPDFRVVGTSLEDLGDDAFRDLALEARWSPSRPASSLVCLLHA